jgi:hypothetical protein
MLQASPLSFLGVPNSGLASLIGTEAATLVYCLDEAFGGQAGCFVYYNGTAWVRVPDNRAVGTAQAIDSTQFVTQSVDFEGGAFLVEVEVTAAWVSVNTRFSFSFTPETAEGAIFEQLQCGVVSLTPGVGFTLSVAAPSGAVGLYIVNIVGIG